MFISKKFVVSSIFRRYCHCKSSEVRVRFAPSPTGFLHLGGLRTALYNYLFAKSRNGKCVLRIEDTDQTRKVDGAVERLVSDLNWVGIDFDEGPTQGGPYGPYTQSERLNVYKEHTDRLLDNGSAYRCFCTPVRLDLLRRESVKLRQIPKYDNRCRNLSREESQSKLEGGETFCVRLKLIGVTEFLDLVYGPTRHDVSAAEGDPVIFKADQFPTYHLANVVDDHLMRITHVLRGIEWQVSTAKHLILYRAFGWTPPVYAHLPLVLNSDGSKLSKRQDDITIQHFQNTGTLPGALVNFVTRAGGGFNIEHHERDLISFPMEYLVEKFDISKLNTNSCKLQMDKLPTSNNLEIVRLLTTETGTEYLVDRVRNLLHERVTQRGDASADLPVDTDQIKSILNWGKHRLKSLDDLFSEELEFLWVLPHYDAKTHTIDDVSLKLLRQLSQELSYVAIDKDSLSDYLKEATQTRNIKFAKFMALLRAAVSGTKHGPSIAEMIDILGRENTIARINAFISKAENTDTRMGMQ